MFFKYKYSITKEFSVLDAVALLINTSYFLIVFKFLSISFSAHCAILVSVVDAVFVVSPLAFVFVLPLNLDAFIDLYILSVLLSPVLFSESCEPTLEIVYLPSLQHHECRSSLTGGP